MPALSSIVHPRTTDLPLKTIRPYNHSLMERRLPEEKRSAKASRPMVAQSDSSVRFSREPSRENRRIEKLPRSFNSTPAGSAFLAAFGKFRPRKMRLESFESP
jgi:hypothetical protein